MEIRAWVTIFFFFGPRTKFRPNALPSCFLPISAKTLGKKNQQEMLKLLLQIVSNKSLVDIIFNPR